MDCFFACFEVSFLFSLMGNQCKLVLFSPHMTSVVGTLHVGKYIRSRYTFHFFIQILSLFYTDFVAILYLFCRQLGVRPCFVLFLMLFHTTFVAKLELTPIYAKFVAKLELTPIYAQFVAKLVLVAEFYRFCCFFLYRFCYSFILLLSPSRCYL